MKNGKDVNACAKSKISRDHLLLQIIQSFLKSDLKIRPFLGYLFNQKYEI